MEEQSVKKNYLYNLIYQLLLLIVPLITTPYISRVLTSEGVGDFSYTTSMVSYFTLFGNIGINTYGQLKIAKSRKDKAKTSAIFYELTLLKTMLMSIAIAVYYLFIFALSFEKYKILYHFLILQIFAVLFDISWFFQGKEEFKKLLFRNGFVKVISTILIFALIKKQSDIYLYSVITYGSMLLGNLSIWFYLPKYLSTVKIHELNPFIHFKSCLLYFIPTIATAIYLTIDKTMIGWFSPNSLENGYYEQAHKIEQMAVTAITSLSLVGMPRMAFIFKENNDKKINDYLYRCFCFTMLISFPMCFGLMAVSNRFIPLYLGGGFEKSIVLLRIQSLLLVIIGLNNAVGKLILMPSGKQKEYNKAVIVGAICNVFINISLIPKYLSVGAAVSSVISEFVILLIFAYYAREYIRQLKLFRNFFVYCGSGMIMYVLIKYLFLNFTITWGTLLLQIIAGIFVYFSLVIALRDRFLICEIKNFIKIIKNKRNNV